MPKVDKKWCVYAHSVNGVIVYIGMGNVDRAFFIYDRNSRWHKAVLLTKIKEFKLTILKRFVSRDAARRYEQSQIETHEPSCNIVYHPKNWTAAIRKRSAGVRVLNMIPKGRKRA